MAEPRSQVERIKAKVSGETGRNGLNIIGTAGQSVNMPKRISVAVSPKTNQQRSGETTGPSKKPVRSKDIPTHPGTNQQRSSKGSAYGALPSSKGGANMKGVD